MADVGGSSSCIDVESFEFVPLHEYMSDNRKVSRKKHILNYRQEQLFVPEGHFLACYGRQLQKIRSPWMWALRSLVEHDTLSHLHGNLETLLLFSNALFMRMMLKSRTVSL